MYYLWIPIVMFLDTWWEISAKNSQIHGNKKKDSNFQRKTIQPWAGIVKMTMKIWSSSEKTRGFQGPQAQDKKPSVETELWSKEVLSNTCLLYKHSSLLPWHILLLTLPELVAKYPSKQPSNIQIIITYQNFYSLSLTCPNKCNKYFTWGCLLVTGYI